jgi:hypothetical protein
MEIIWVLNPSICVRAKPEQGQIGKAEKMLKKVTTNIKAAVVLIVTENVAALRMFVKNVTNSVFKSISKRQDAKLRGKKRP